MSMAMAYGMKKRAKKKYAMGGEAESGDTNSFQDGIKKIAGEEPEAETVFSKGGEVYKTEDRALDMIGKIMEKRSAGAVANDVGVAEADKLPAEYDDLVLRDDFEDTSGPGNEIGDEDVAEEDSDVVSKILSSRKKKDKMPRPA